MSRFRERQRTRARRSSRRAQNEVESLRLRAGDYEFIVAQHGSFTLVVKQLAHLSHARLGAGEEAEEAGTVEEKKDN